MIVIGILIGILLLLCFCALVRINENIVLLAELLKKLHQK